MIKPLKKLIDRILSDSYYRNSIILIVFTTAISILQYVFQIYANRNLSKDDYGLMNTLLSLLTITCFIGSVLKTWSTKVFSQVYSLGSFKQSGKVFRYFYKWAGICLLALLIAAIPSVPFLMTLYKTDNLMLFVLVYVMIFLEYIKIPLHSYLESFNRFFARSMAMFINSFARVGMLGIFLLMGMSLEKSLLAMIVGYLAGNSLFLIFSLPQFSKHPVEKPENADKVINTTDFSYFYKIGLAILFNTLIQNMDMQIARINLSEDISGDFATASVLGKTIFWVGGITLPLFFVSINEAFHRKAPYIKPFVKGLGIEFLITLGGLGFLLIIIEPFVRFFNPAYLNALDSIRYYAVAVIPYVFVNFFVNFYISIDKYRVFILLLVLVLIQSALMYFFGKTVLDIITIRLISGIVILGAMVGYFILRRNHFYEVEGETKHNKISGS